MNTKVLSSFPHMVVTAGLSLKVEIKGTVENMLYYNKAAKSHLQYCIKPRYSEAT